MSIEQLGLPKTDPERIEELEAELVTLRSQSETKISWLTRRLESQKTILFRVEQINEAIDKLSDWGSCYVYGHSMGDGYCYNCPAHYRDDADEIPNKVEEVLKILSISLAPYPGSPVREPRKQTQLNG